jgi:hypothetical protein
MPELSHTEEIDLKTTFQRLRNRIKLLEDVIDDFGHALDRAEQERRNEHAELKAKIDAMEGYRDEQIAPRHRPNTKPRCWPND